MIALHQLTTPPSACEYLPDQQWSLHYVFVRQASAADYQAGLEAGWRRFGRAFFHPVCSECKACQSLRVRVDAFEPDRSQRRARQANADVALVVGEPEVTAERLRLYDRFHAYQSAGKGWAVREPKSPIEYATSVVDNPFETGAWACFQEGRLIGVGYVDVLPHALSAIYFYYDPDKRARSLGTFNVLRIIDSAAARGIPYVYLGYYVEGCRSLEYKARFRPNEVLADGQWRSFQS